MIHLNVLEKIKIGTRGIKRLKKRFITDRDSSAPSINVVPK
jgi:hypothetical protein